MRIFLGVIMVLFVSGDEETVKGFVGDNVLLPCLCSDRKSDEEFKWQMESPNVLLFKYNKTSSNFYDRFQDRAKTFFGDSSNNCSVLLTNITVGDQGKYKCIYYTSGMYIRFLLHLKVLANYTICQKDSNTNGISGEKVFSCGVQGRYREAEIQWKLGEKLLTDSPNTSITQTNSHSASVGLYHFSSTLITKRNATSEPTCHVKAKNISEIILIPGCRMVSDFSIDPLIPVPGNPKRYFIIIPIVLVLGFSLVLWCRWKFPRRLLKRTKMETDAFLCQTHKTNSNVTNP